MFRGNARILVRWGEDIGQNFIHDFLLSHVVQWRRQNFGSGGQSAKMHSSKTEEKIFKFLKILHKNLMNSLNFIKTEFNRI